MSLENYSITVSGTWLSDLFFNFEHPNWKEALRAKDASLGQMRKALDDDADLFLLCIPEEQRSTKLRDALVDDFRARL